MDETKEEFVVPYEAAERGSLVVGELKSEQATFPSMLVQFSKVIPSSRKAKIFLYPTLEQAKRLFAMRPPFSFRGTYASTADVDEVWAAEGIWTQSGSQIGGKDRMFWSAPIGDIESLTIESRSTGSIFKSTEPFAWFATNRCFVLQMLANPEDKELEEAKTFGFQREKFFLEVSDGAIAEIRQYLRSRQMGVSKDIRKKAYSVHIRNYKSTDEARKDAEAMMILASFGSRERTMFWHWSNASGVGDMTRRWRFNASKFRRRDSHEDPLLPRDRDACQRFLKIAFPFYRSAIETELFDSAVYALLAREQVLEVRIARLFAGVQSALVFALQQPRGSARPKMSELYEKFLAKYGTHFDDLWPLLWDSAGPSLADLRNAVAHGDTFTEADFLGLSYAAQNLEWILERMLLLILGWKIADSHVSLRSLQRYFAHQWKPVQMAFTI